MAGSVFDEMREKIREVGNSCKLNDAIHGGIDDVVALFMWIIDWVEAEGEHMLIVDKEDIERMIATCDETYEKLINKVWVLPMNWEENIPDADKNNENISMIVKNLITILDFSLEQVSEDHTFYNKFKEYIDKKKDELDATVLQKRVKLWLELPEV